VVELQGVCGMVLAVGKQRVKRRSEGEGEGEGEMGEARLSVCLSKGRQD